ncbi:MAG: hypothetical protein V1789_09590 [PVC group bacterium]
MNNNHLWKLCAFILPVLFSLSCARSTALLRGDAAAEYLADNDHLIAPGYYTFGEVKNRQSGVLMVAVFNRDRGGKDDGNFEFARREKSMGYQSTSNPYNVILLNSPGGERGADPTDGNREEIRKNDLAPVIVLNADGEEEAVVFKPAGQSLAAFIRPNGLIRLEIGQREPNQGDIVYSLDIGQSFKSTKKAPPRREPKKEKEAMSEIKIGDLVQWATGNKTRVGVVKKVNKDGTSVINIPTTSGSREEKIKTERLKVITSTIESDSD